MTVSTSYTPLTWAGNSSTTAFPISWPFFTGSLVVTAISSTGIETVQTLTTHYTVSGGTDANGLPATGTVTMLTAPATGTTLRVTRATPKTQSSTWSESDGFPQKTVEAMADRLTLITQEGASGTASDGISGDVMQLVTGGADPDYWDAEGHIIRDVADAVLATDAVNYGQLQDEVLLVGSGNVVGPASAVNNRIAAFDGTTGKILEDGGLTIAELITAVGGRNAIFNVVDYGALNDASTDDTTAIQAAVAAAKAAGGGVIYFPPGDGYRITAGIEIDFSRCALIGYPGRTSYIYAPNAVTAFLFSTDDPENDMIADLAVCNLTIWGPTAPTSGIGIKFVRATRLYVSNVDVRAFFHGIAIEGGNEHFYSNFTVGGAVWSSAAAGSYLFGLFRAAYGATNEAPSEIFVSNFNFKGTPTPYLENAIYLASCDGLFMANGHVGFASNAGLSIVGTGADSNIVNIDLANVMFDGNAGTAGFGVNTAGTSGGVIRELKFTGCVFSGHDNHGARLALAALRTANFTGCKFTSNDDWGFIAEAGTDISLTGNSFYANNAVNSTSGDISLNAVTGVLVSGNTFNSGSPVSTYAILVGSGSNDQITIANNIIIGASVPIQINSTVDDLRLINNTSEISDVIASANPLPIPNWGDHFHVSGTTAFSTISGAAAVGRVVTLIFDGALTVSSGASLEVKGTFVSEANAAMTLFNDGTIWRETSRSPIQCKSTVANMPAAGRAGYTWFATNGRKNGEGGGAGTGVLCFDDGTAWRACDTGATVAA